MTYIQGVWEEREAQKKLLLGTEELLSHII
jgi:hypothetical protein